MRTQKKRQSWKAWALVNQFGHLNWVSNSRREKPVKPGLPGNRHYRVVRVTIRKD